MLNIFTNIKNKTKNYLSFFYVKKYKTTMQRELSKKYFVYYQKCKKTFSSTNHSFTKQEKSIARHFNKHGIAHYQDAMNEKIAASFLKKIKEEEQNSKESIWDQDNRYCNGDIFQKFSELEEFFSGSVLNLILQSIYKSEFKIFYGLLYKSINTKEPSGSQLWHTDGGPGTCINLMFCLSETSKENGAIEFLPWKYTLAILKNQMFSHHTKNTQNLLRLDNRRVKCEFYENTIKHFFADKVLQPTGNGGLVIPFRNNILHKGGYPLPLHTRYVCVFHIYPSTHPFQTRYYKDNGIKKTNPYPNNPNLEN